MTHEHIYVYTYTCVMGHDRKYIFYCTMSCGQKYLKAKGIYGQKNNSSLEK